MKPTIEAFLMRPKKPEPFRRFPLLVGNIFRQPRRPISPRRRLSTPPCGAVAPCVDTLEEYAKRRPRLERQAAPAVRLDRRVPDFPPGGRRIGQCLSGAGRQVGG